MSKIDLDMLKDQIQRAFADVARPERESIVPHACDDCWRLRDALADCTVNDLRADVLAPYCWDSALLSDQAKQYFLPAWFFASFEKPDWDFADAALIALDFDHRWSPERGYSSNQRAAICSYLKYLDVVGDEITRERVATAMAKWRGNCGAAD